MTNTTRKRTRSQKLKIRDISFHRNGICGIPFYATLFHDGDSQKVGIVFITDGHCAVLDLKLLADENIKFGVNSWRGDHYEPLLRDAIYNQFGTSPALVLPAADRCDQYQSRLPIVIEVEGGCVVDVRNIPDGYAYQIVDHDVPDESGDDKELGGTDGGAE